MDKGKRFTNHKREREMINTDELTLGQIKELNSVLGSNSQESSGLNSMVGQKCIIRTYSAGVWFGTIEQKSKDEVIVKDARRMWRWWAAESISLSAVALHGIKQDKSQICEAVNAVWLQPVELIPCTQKAIESIEGAQNVKAS